MRAGGSWGGCCRKLRVWGRGPCLWALLASVGALNSESTSSLWASGSSLIKSRDWTDSFGSESVSRRTEVGGGRGCVAPLWRERGHDEMMGGVGVSAGACRFQRKEPRMTDNQGV